MSYLVALLKSQEKEDHLYWIAALDKYQDKISYDIIELTKNDWLDKVLAKEYDLCICRPPGRNSVSKQLYDERVLILINTLEKKLYPSLDELLIYENKRFLSYYLKAKAIPHARTYVYYDAEEAIDNTKDLKLPLVGKLNIGAGGSGVQILNNREALLEYINKSFSKKGIRRRWYPNLRKGDLFKRAFNRIKSPKDSAQYFKQKRESAIKDTQKDNVLLQEYIPETIEWRVVRIGESFFAHKKIAAKGDIKSGTSKVEWGDPPKTLLDFSRKISEKNNLKSLALDIFEDKSGNFFINELQCYFGSKNPHQMIVNEKPGRYIYNRTWQFEEGSFNENNSHDLRVKHILGILNERQ